MADDVLLNKASIIERCLERIKKEYASDPQKLRKNITCQDSIVLNLERACEASIDIAMRLVRKYKLGVPQDSRQAFQLLTERKKISKQLSERLQAMVGFRNIAIHDYQSLNLDIVQSILDKNLNDFKKWVRVALKESK